MPRFYNPAGMAEPMNPYSHGAEVQAGSRMIFFAGQVGTDLDGNMPADFESQITNTYKNIGTILNDAGMDYTNLVKLTTFLIDPEHGPLMREIRKSFMGDHKPAHTLLYISRLAYPEFLIEVEGCAAED
jgi:enamine deaminase RidA (YjgF/YER057c/UK114 family)